MAAWLGRVIGYQRAFDEQRVRHGRIYALGKDQVWIEDLQPRTGRDKCWVEAYSTDIVVEVRPFPAVEEERPAGGPRRFYQQTYVAVILTEVPGDADLQHLPDSVDTGGDCLLSFGLVRTDVLNGKEAADALYAAGSQPAFFQLDDEGNDIE